MLEERRARARPREVGALHTESDAQPAICTSPRSRVPGLLRRRAFIAFGIVGVSCLVRFGWGMEYAWAAFVFIVGWFVGCLWLAESTPFGDWLDSKTTTGVSSSWVMATRRRAIGARPARPAATPAHECASENSNTSPVAT